MAFRVLMIICTAALLAGCGQKGPLYIPEASSAAEHSQHIS